MAGQPVCVGLLGQWSCGDIAEIPTNVSWHYGGMATFGCPTCGRPGLISQRAGDAFVPVQQD